MQLRYVKVPDIKINLELFLAIQLFFHLGLILPHVTYHAQVGDILCIIIFLDRAGLDLFVEHACPH